jgi:hypothetical protein
MSEINKGICKVFDEEYDTLETTRGITKWEHKNLNNE